MNKFILFRPKSGKDLDLISMRLNSNKSITLLNTKKKLDMGSDFYKPVFISRGKVPIKPGISGQSKPKKVELLRIGML